MKYTWRILLGFFLAPLITPTTFMAAALLRDGAIESQSLAVFILVGSFSYAATIIFGGPTFLLYWGLGLKNHLWFLIGGALIGLIIFLLLGVLLGGGMKQPTTFLVAASLSGLVFRLIAGSAPFERKKST